MKSWGREGEYNQNTLYETFKELIKVFKIFHFYYFNYVCMYVLLGAHGAQSSDLPGAMVTGGCALPDVGARN